MQKATVCAAGDRMDGFVVRSVTTVEDLRLTALELEHEASGARLLHLLADDPENLFSVTFPTPPANDTGLPHIMEHSVLCGSKTYPVRSPYFEMRKMSMATFINAMTAPAFTLYPMASNVPADLFNLAAVCFDAVFHPLLERETFLTQAHHLEPVDPADPAGPWKISGIVYNEMKGALSDPERRLFLLEQRNLVPETALGQFSGGDPEVMPELTYEDFREFHRVHYHPSNAYFVVYGDIATPEYTSFLGPRLDEFGRQSAPAPIPPHPRWSAPRQATASYPAADAEPTAGRAFHALSWLAGNADDPATELRWKILGRLLAGDETAPLRRALFDARLATRLIGSGAQSIGPEIVFRVAGGGADAERAEEFEQCVLEALEGVTREGLDAGDIESALLSVAYQHLEIGRMHPLHLMQRSVTGWIQGVEPIAHLRMGRLLDSLRADLKNDPGLFVHMIREGLLDNPHRLRSTLVPEPGGAARMQTEARERMVAIENRLDATERQRLADEAERIRTDFARPNSPESVALLPQLGIGDIPRDPPEIPTTCERLADNGELLVNEVFSNGIEYLCLDFDLCDLPDELWPFLPRFGDALRKMGTTRRGYQEIARALAAHTGGVDFDTHCETHASDASRSVRGFMLEIKALETQLPAALDLLRELLFELDPSDLARLGEVTRESYAAMRSRARQAGSFLVGGSHAARGWSAEDHALDLVGGVPQLNLLRRFSETGASHDELLRGIQGVQTYLLACPFVTASFTGSPAGEQRVRRALTEWLGALGPHAPPAGRPEFQPWSQPAREGLACAIDVAHSAAVLPAPHASHPDQTLIQIGSHLVKYGYLLPEIRFKGNAYGVETVYRRLLSSWSVFSFRDPHVTRTLRVFDGILDHVRGAQWSEQDVHHAIIAQAKLDQMPIRPEGATQLALYRHRYGLTPASRKARRERLLAATPGEVHRAMFELLEPALPRASVCVMASRARLEEANRELGDGALKIETLDI